MCITRVTRDLIRCHEVNPYTATRCAQYIEVVTWCATVSKLKCSHVVPGLTLSQSKYDVRRTALGT